MIREEKGIGEESVNNCLPRAAFMIHYSLGLSVLMIVTLVTFCHLLPPSGFTGPFRILCSTLTVDLTNKL